MNYAKDLIDENHNKVYQASLIALKAGVLTKCSYHDDEVFVDEKDVVEAHKRGNARFEKDSLDKIFASCKEMTDCIDEAVDNANLRCGMCSRLHTG